MPATGPRALTTTALASSVFFSSVVLTLRLDGGLGGFSTDTDASSAEDICADVLDEAKLSFDVVMVDDKRFDFRFAGSSSSLSLSEPLDVELSEEVVSTLLDSEESGLEVIDGAVSLFGEGDSLGDCDGSFANDLLEVNLTGDFIEGDFCKPFVSADLGF